MFSRRPTTFGLLALLALAPVPGCGGGGGGAAGGGGSGDPRLEVALQALRDCPEPALEAVRLLRAFRDVLDVGAPNPPRLTFLEVVGSTVTWTLDTDGDGTEELTGSVRFRDAAGATITPIDLNQLVTSGQRLATFFVGVNPTTQVVLTFAGSSINVSGQFIGILGTGVVDQMSGNLSDQTTAGCEGVFSFDPAPFVVLGGAFPNVTFDLQITAGPDLLIGSMEVPGSATAMVVVRLGGSGDPFTFFLNLVSGNVTE